MLTKAFTLVLVMLIGLALGLETARTVHGQPTFGMVNIHLAVFAGVLLIVLWVSRAWLARQWTCFTVWLELTFDGLFDFNSLNVGDGLGSVSVHNSAVRGDVVAGHIHTLKQLHSGSVRLEPLPPPGTPDCEACAQDAFDDAAKTTCSGCGKRGHWSPDCLDARPPPSPPPSEGRQPDGNYVIEVGANETHEDVVRRHPDVLFIHQESGDILCKRGGPGAVIVRRKEQ